jgi:hypothetical protein
MISYIRMLLKVLIYTGFSFWLNNIEVYLTSFISTQNHTIAELKKTLPAPVETDCWIKLNPV